MRKKKKTLSQFYNDLSFPPMWIHFCSWIFTTTCVFKGKFTPEGCNIVLDIIEYKLDLPQDEEYD